MKESQKDHRLPKGFTLIDGPSKHKVLVPTFLVPDTKVVLEGVKTKEALSVDEATPGPLPYHNRPFQGIAEGLVHIPADPDLCEREALTLHSEVKALQMSLGISYKDAAHRLYMAEVEKLKIRKQTEPWFTELLGTIDDTINNELSGPISQIDRGELK